jgi:hypothetical protein
MLIIGCDFHTHSAYLSSPHPRRAFRGERAEIPRAEKLLSEPPPSTANHRPPTPELAHRPHQPKSPLLP